MVVPHTHTMHTGRGVGSIGAWDGPGEGFGLGLGLGPGEYVGFVRVGASGRVRGICGFRLNVAAWWVSGWPPVTASPLRCRRRRRALAAPAGFAPAGPGLPGLGWRCRALCVWVGFSG